MSMHNGIPPEFYGEFAAWVRIEPRSRSDDFSLGLQARTADPLWMLGRQWQFGELDGQDSGSPIAVYVKHSSQSLDHIRLDGANQCSPFPEVPLETFVEREGLSLNWRARAQIGQQFERFVREALGAAADATIDSFRREWPYPGPDAESLADLDRPTLRYVRFMTGRVIDGGQLLEAVRRQTVPRPSTVSDPQLTGILERLNDWYARLWWQPEPERPAEDQPTNWALTATQARSRAWRNAQLAYRFELNPPANGADSVDNKTHLIAPDYRNGDLDWYSFSATSGIRGDWVSDEFRAYPTRITAGGTSPRWWAFEDAATDFGAIDVAKPDLARLLLMEFVLVYGDDWYSVPLTVTMPRLVKLDSLRVRNVFGEELPIASVRRVVRHSVEVTADEDPELLQPYWERACWQLFALTPGDASGEDGADFAEVGDVLFIPPAAGFREESKPLEAVHFLRDEGANRVFGVEQTVMNGIGRPVHAFDAQRERLERVRAREIAVAEELLRMTEQELAQVGLTDEERQLKESQATDLRTRLTLLRDGPRARSGMPQYTLMTRVAENWIPFDPVRALEFFGFPSSYSGREIRLRRKQMLRNIDGFTAIPVPAMTQMLSLNRPVDPDPSLENPEGCGPLLWLEESAVPRSGRRVQITAQRARWVDGKTYVWLGRRVLTGRGEGASGLRFDVLLSQEDAR